MDFINKTKNLLAPEKPMTPDGRVDRVDQCRLLWYNWKFELPLEPPFSLLSKIPIPISPEDSLLNQATGYDISNHLENFNYDKSLDSPGGGFSFTLQNSMDWAKYLKPGQWISVFLSGDGGLSLPSEAMQRNAILDTKIIKTLGKLANKFGLSIAESLPLPPAPEKALIQAWQQKGYSRCIGIIQRVSIKSVTTESGTVEIVYHVQGKDFGKIYEDTELWFNANHAEYRTFESNVLARIKTQDRTLANMLNLFYDAFLDTSKLMPSKITTPDLFVPKQWLMPDALVSTHGFKPEKSTYFGTIAEVKEFHPTAFEFPQPDPISGITGHCWDKFKYLSQPEFHELFTEMDEGGHPKLIFRPIPWGLDPSKYPVLSKFMMSYSGMVQANSLSNTVDSLKEAISARAQKALAPLKSVANYIPGAGGLFATTLTNPRSIHSLFLPKEFVEGFDVGPDQHQRINFFLADTTKDAQANLNASSIMLSSLNKEPIPLRNEMDIKRHGFRPLILDIQSYMVQDTTLALFNNHLFGDTPTRSFILEINQILKDFYAGGVDFYTGYINLAAGLNAIKLGKALIVDPEINGIGDMVFYIEGYADAFTVNQDGTGSWTQSVKVTRGIPRTALLKTSSLRDKRPTKASTFHSYNKTSGGGLLDAAKNDLQKVKDLIG